MSSESAFTRENLDSYLKDLSKEFRKLNGTKMPAEIILVGGASILLNYAFREMTYDMDAVIHSSSVMKDAINHVGDKHGLPNGWLNTDCTHTKSHSSKLPEVSIYYKTFSNILTVRTVAAEYLIAMKLMSGRKYKNDLSDVVGILWEHKKSNTPITHTAMNIAVCTLYGGWENIPEESRIFFEAAFENGDYEALYRQRQITKLEAKEILLEFNIEKPNTLNEQNATSVLAKARQKKMRDQKER